MNENIQEIEDYLMNNDATVMVKSFWGENGPEYEACIIEDKDGQPYDQVCEAYSNVSFGDALRQLSVALTNRS